MNDGKVASCGRREALDRTGDWCILMRNSLASRLMMLNVIVILFVINVSCMTMTNHVREERSRLFEYIENNDTAAIQELIAKGETISIRNSFNETPLIVACQLYRSRATIVKMLLAAGADVNEKGNINFTPLIQAASGQNPELVEMLLDAGANIEAADVYGYRAMHKAACSNRRNIEILHAYGAQLESRSIFGETPLLCATQSPGTERIDYLIRIGADTATRSSSGLNALYHAVYAGQYRNAQTLLSYGVSVSDTEYSTGYTPLFVATKKSDKDMMKLLIENRSNINSTDNNGRTIMHHLVELGDYQLLEWLITYRPDNLADIYGMTPKGYAQESGHGREQIIELLQRNGY